MNETVQYELFEELSPSDLETLRAEMASQRDQLGNLRRGIFARHGALRTLVLDLQTRLRRIELELGIRTEECEDVFELQTQVWLREKAREPESGGSLV